jgi:hypothetical protein
MQKLIPTGFVMLIALFCCAGVLLAFELCPINMGVDAGTRALFRTSSRSTHRKVGAAEAQIVILGNPTRVPRNRGQS